MNGEFPIRFFGTETVQREGDLALGWSTHIVGM